MSWKSARVIDVALVIPTYNAVEFVAGALASVFAQSQLPREIVVVDDASTDGTPDVVEAIARHSPVPITVIRRTSNAGGPARPLNAAIASTTCELVAILEQDDVMAPRRLELLAGAAHRHPQCCLIVGRPAIVTDTPEGIQWQGAVAPPVDIRQFADAGEGESFVVSSPDAFRALMKGNFIYSNSNLMLRKRCFDSLGGFDDSWSINSDADLEFKMIAAAPLAVVNAPLCGYRVRATSLYHSKYQRARVDGLLIRLEWGSRHWDWAAAETKSVYWALRPQLGELLRRREFRQALKVARTLTTSSALRRHLLSTIGVGSF
jgi:glycosyltransferase involved in cell wall biosynthesis